MSLRLLAQTQPCKILNSVKLENFSTWFRPPVQASIKSVLEYSNKHTYDVFLNILLHSPAVYIKMLTNQELALKKSCL